MAELIYKVLIADDEYWTREKLRTMIDWKQYNLEFQQPAVDGEDVLEKIKLNVPDILITDINMPFVSGLDLIKILKEEYPDIVVFVISGYDDFAYVKMALLEGAINYLLKPVTKIDLVNTLSKALEIISNREQVEKEQEEQRLQIRKEASYIQDREFSLFVEKEEMGYSPTIMMNSNIIAGCSLVLIKIHNLNELVTQYHYDMNHLSYSVKKSIKEITGYENLLIFNYIFRSNEFIIISEVDNNKLLKVAQLILKYLSSRTNSPISIIVSEHSYSIESIHAAYIQSVAMLMLRKYKKESVITFCDKNNLDMKAVIKNPITDEIENKIKSLIKSGNQNALKTMIFETVGLKNCERDAWSLLEVKQTVKKICHLLLDIMAEGKAFAEILDMENMVDLATKTVENLSVESISELLEEMIDLTADLQKQDMSGSIRSVVKHAVTYIEQNFFENLTLTSLSQKFNVESSYFSKVFRQETGDNLTSYIAKKRVNKAIEYMKDSKINLTEIAFMVGYDDYTYFNRVFRKMTGVSPRDYRNDGEVGGN
ncbi:MAG: helix-turn-helix domain-containing protein [Velocimicrobium sp.]